MKTVLFLVLCSPVAAFASYDCTRDNGLAMKLTVDTSDVSAVKVMYGNEPFSAVLVQPGEHSVFASTTYALSNPGKRTGDEITGQLTISEMPLMTRGGPHCGRGGCDDAPAYSVISAELVIGTDEPIEFSCDQTLP